MKIRLKNSEEFNMTLLLKGFSQRGFGRAVGISEPYANQIANGERNPGPNVAKRICDVLEVKFEDIFFVERACNSKKLNPTGTE